MFNPTAIVIDAFIGELRSMYDRTYGILEPSYPGIISFVAGLALENIATSDAAYHDVNHTIQVTRATSQGPNSSKEAPAVRRWARDAPLSQPCPVCWAPVWCPLPGLSLCRETLSASGFFVTPVTFGADHTGKLKTLAGEPQPSSRPLSEVLN